jgi:uncharacterized protein (DUF849 family)
MTVVDPGSVNFTRRDMGTHQEPGFVYLNPEADTLEGLALCEAAKLTPSYAIYEPGFTRAGAALAAGFPGLLAPLYRFMFSDQFAWGFPPRDYALDAHLRLLEDEAPGATWMVAGLGVDIAPLIPFAVERRGHVRVGLEDAPFGSSISNVAQVEAAVRLVHQAGSEPATAQEVRAGLRA